MLAAGSISDQITQRRIIDQIHAYASINIDNDPFDVIYNLVNGTGQGTSGGSPSQGAIFSLLALKWVSHAVCSILHG